MAFQTKGWGIPLRSGLGKGSEGYLAVVFGVGHQESGMDAPGGFWSSTQGCQASPALRPHPPSQAHCGPVSSATQEQSLSEQRTLS